MLYNEHVILMDFGNRLDFRVEDSKYQLAINIEFVFSSGGEKLKSDIKITEDGSRVTITLFQWDSNSMGHIEVQEPLKLNLKNGKKLWLKYRTQTSDKSNFRNFHLTVWGEEGVS